MGKRLGIPHGVPYGFGMTWYIMEDIYNEELTTYLMEQTMKTEVSGLPSLS